MMPLIVWLEEAQWRYFLVADTTLGLVLAVVLAGVLFPRVSEHLECRRGTLAFAGIVLLALVAARWPTFFVLHRMNPDEAQMAAQAITALKFPTPWLQFDSGSSGPLNTYVLMLPMLVGVHPTFMTARIIAVLLEFGSLAAMYIAIRSIAQPWTARVAVVPPLIFWCVSTQEDYVHYSSEHLPIFLATLAVALVALGRTRYYPRALAYAAGVLVGALPFAKLQSAPIMLAVFALAAVAYLSCAALTLRDRFARIVSLAQGTCTIPLVLCAAMVWGDSFSDFRHSYIETSLAYMIYQSRLWWFLTTTSEFGPYFSWLAPIAVAGSIVLAVAFRKIDAPLRGGFAAALLVLVAAVYAIKSPGRTSPHYLLFAIVPLAASGALALNVVAQALRGAAFARYAPAALVCAFVAAGTVVDGAFLRPGRALARPRFFGLHVAGSDRPDRRGYRESHASGRTARDLGLDARVLGLLLDLARHARFRLDLRLHDESQSQSRLLPKSLRRGFQTQSSPRRFWIRAKSRCLSKTATRRITPYPNSPRSSIASTSRPDRGNAFTCSSAAIWPVAIPPPESRKR